MPMINYPAAIGESKAETRMCSHGEYGFEGVEKDRRRPEGNMQDEATV